MADLHAGAFNPAISYDIDMVETLSKSCFSSPEVPLVNTLKALVSLGPGSLSSGSRYETEKEEQLASDCTNEGNTGPFSVLSNVIWVDPIEALVKVEVSGAAKGNQDGKARHTKADSIYNPKIHVAWVAAVSHIFIHCHGLSYLISWFQCNICSKGNKVCFGPAYMRDKGTESVQVASKRCVRCVVDRNVCWGSEFSYTVKFLDTYAPSDGEGDPPVTSQPKHVIPTKCKVSVGNVPTRARPYPPLGSPLQIGSSS